MYLFTPLFISITLYRSIQTYLLMQDDDFEEYESAPSSSQTPQLQQPRIHQQTMFGVKSEDISMKELQSIQPNSQNSALITNRIQSQPLIFQQQAQINPIWPQLDKVSSIHDGVNLPINLNFNKTYSLPQQKSEKTVGQTHLHSLYDWGTDSLIPSNSATESNPIANFLYSTEPTLNLTLHNQNNIDFSSLNTVNGTDGNNSLNFTIQKSQMLPNNIESISQNSYTLEQLNVQPKQAQQAEDEFIEAVEAQQAKLQENEDFIQASQQKMQNIPSRLLQSRTHEHASLWNEHTYQNINSNLTTSNNSPHESPIRSIPTVASALKDSFLMTNLQPDDEKQDYFQTNTKAQPFIPPEPKQQQPSQLSMDFQILGEPQNVAPVQQERKISDEFFSYQEPQIKQSELVNSPNLQQHKTIQQQIKHQAEQQDQFGDFSETVQISSEPPNRPSKSSIQNGESTRVELKEQNLPYNVESATKLAELQGLVDGLPDLSFLVRGEFVV